MENLFTLFMFRVFFAERTVFGNRKPVGVVALILITVVIAVLALGTFERYLGSYVCLLSHLEKLRTKKLPPHASACKV